MKNKIIAKKSTISPRKDFESAFKLGRVSDFPRKIRVHFFFRQLLLPPVTPCNPSSTGPPIYQTKDLLILSFTDPTIWRSTEPRI